MDSGEAFGAKQREAIARIVSQVGHMPDGVSVSAYWENEQGWEASVTADPESVVVYFGPASKVVASLQEAAALLKGIFADEIVCVTALANERPVHQALARFDDPSASFTALDTPSGFNMPAINDVQVRSWTGARDRE